MITKPRKLESTKDGANRANENGNAARFELLSSRIIEAAIDVHKELWPGFIESVYENAMRVALRSRGIEFEDQKRIRIQYRGVDVGSHRLADRRPADRR